MIDEIILSMKDEIIKSLQECVRIKSVRIDPKEGMPFGEGVHKALEYCLALSESFGFRTFNMDNMIGYAEYGSGDEMIAVLGHLDVVPEGSGWTYPPYAGEVHDGKIYGRGTTDDKGPVIGALYALKALKMLDIPLKKRVRIFFGLNEETGSRCVKHYVENGGEMPVYGFTPDAEYPIINGEKGIVNCKYTRKVTEKGDIFIKSIKGGIAPNVVPDYAEALLYVPEVKKKEIKRAADMFSDICAEEQENGILIRAKGISAHGSTPEKGINAISVLMMFLGSLDMKGTAGEIADFMNQYIGMDVNGKNMGIYLEDEVSGKFIFNLGTIAGDEDSISIEINMRYPVTRHFEEFIDILIEKMASGGFEQEYLTHKKSLYVSPEKELIKKLSKVYEEKVGKKVHLISIGGGTYAKAMENIVAFGPIFEGQPMVEHKPDEYIEIDSLIKNTQIMAAAIKELAE